MYLSPALLFLLMAAVSLMLFIVHKGGFSEGYRKAREEFEKVPVEPEDWSDAP